MSEEKPSNVSQKMCELCKNNTSKYCCPRCNILYCSVNCYKSEQHANCSETFYRECINEELASYQPDDESKNKMIDILKKMQNEEIDNEGLNVIDEVDSDDEGGIGLDERLEGLNLNDADAVWEALTEDERNEFVAMLSQGDITSIMPQWEPWWMYSREKKLVEDVDDKTDKIEQEMLEKCPPLFTVPDMSQLTKVEPSQAIRFNIANVLASYAFIVRYFNGEMDPVEAAIYLLNICTNLDTNTNYADLALAVESVKQKCLQSDLIETDEASLNVMKRDTFLILQGPSEQNQKYYCKSALSHLRRILCDARITLKQPKEKKENTGFSKKFPDHKVQDLPNLDMGKVKKCIKKVEYYLSYVQSCSMYFD